MHPNQSLYEMKEYKDGYFEVQDEGSQYIGNKVPIQEGQLVLDLCAGAGGKSLIFAEKLLVFLTEYWTTLFA